MKDLTSNCFLCGEHSLHVAGTEEAQVMQCINCGYTTTTKFIGTKETNEEFQKLSEDMKNWSIEKNNRIWIPSIITLPIGMLYPINIDNMVNHKTEMKWAFAPMVEIPKEERENFPNEQGGFYDKKIDTDNPIIYDKFISGMSHISEKIKESKNAN
jgi:ribosomal protein L37E